MFSTNPKARFGLQSALLKQASHLIGRCGWLKSIVGEVCHWYASVSDELFAGRVPRWAAGVKPIGERVKADAKSATKEQAVEGSSQRALKRGQIGHAALGR